MKKLYREVEDSIRPAPRKRTPAGRKYTLSYSGIVSNLGEELQAKLKFDRSVYARFHSMHKWMMTYGMSVLSRQEFSVLYFILARTVTYGKKAEMITKDHFLKGVWSDNEMLCAPCHITEKYLYTSIRSLEGKGFIKVTPLQYNGRKLPTIFEIEIDFIIACRPTEDTMSKLRLPKATKTAEVIDFDTYYREKRGGFDGVTQHHGSADLMVLPNTPKYINNKNEIHKVIVARENTRNETTKTRIRRTRKPGSEIDCKKVIREVLNVTSARTTAKQNEKVRRAAAAPIASLSLQDINATWKRCMVEKFGRCTVAGLTHKEYGIFKRVMKTHQVPVSWYEFATWVVDNWQRINKEAKEYGDYRKRKTREWSLSEEDYVFLGSESPDISLLVRCYGRLVKRYSQETLRGKVIDTEAVLREENQKLKQRLAATEQEAATTKGLLKRVLAKTPDKTPPKRAPGAVVVDPNKDTFFEKAETDLPDWR